MATALDNIINTLQNDTTTEDNTNIQNIINLENQAGSIQQNLQLDITSSSKPKKDLLSVFNDDISNLFTEYIQAKNFLDDTGTDIVKTTSGRTYILDKNTGEVSIDFNENEPLVNINPTLNLVKLEIDKRVNLLEQQYNSEIENIKNSSLIKDDLKEKLIEEKQKEFEYQKAKLEDILINPERHKEFLNKIDERLTPQLIEIAKEKYKTDYLNAKYGITLDQNYLKTLGLGFAYGLATGSLKLINGLSKLFTSNVELIHNEYSKYGGSKPDIGFFASLTYMTGKLSYEMSKKLGLDDEFLYEHTKKVEKLSKAFTKGNINEISESLFSYLKFLPFDITQSIGYVFGNVSTAVVGAGLAMSALPVEVPTAVATGAGILTSTFLDALSDTKEDLINLQNQVQFDDNKNEIIQKDGKTLFAINFINNLVQNTFDAKVFGIGSEILLKAIGKNGTEAIIKTDASSLLSSEKFKNSVKQFLSSTLLDAGLEFTAEGIDAITQNAIKKWIDNGKDKPLSQYLQEAKGEILAQATIGALSGITMGAINSSFETVKNKLDNLGNKNDNFESLLNDINYNQIIKDTNLLNNFNKLETALENNDIETFRNINSDLQKSFEDTLSLIEEKLKQIEPSKIEEKYNIDIKSDEDYKKIAHTILLNRIKKINKPEIKLKSLLVFRNTIKDNYELEHTTKSEILNTLENVLEKVKVKGSDDTSIKDTFKTIETLLDKIGETDDIIIKSFKNKIKDLNQKLENNEITIEQALKESKNYIQVNKEILLDGFLYNEDIKPSIEKYNDLLSSFLFKDKEEIKDNLNKEKNTLQDTINKLSKFIESRFSENKISFYQNIIGDKTLEEMVKNENKELQNSIKKFLTKEKIKLLEENGIRINPILKMIVNDEINLTSLEDLIENYKKIQDIEYEYKINKTRNINITTTNNGVLLKHIDPETGIIYEEYLNNDGSKKIKTKESLYTRLRSFNNLNNEAKKNTYYDLIDILNKRADKKKEIFESLKDGKTTYLKVNFKNKNDIDISKYFKLEIKNGKINLSYQQAINKDDNTNIIDFNLKDEIENINTNERERYIKALNKKLIHKLSNVPIKIKKNIYSKIENLLSNIDNLQIIKKTTKNGQFIYLTDGKTSTIKLTLNKIGQIEYVSEVKYKKYNQNNTEQEYVTFINKKQYIVNNSFKDGSKKEYKTTFNKIQDELTKSEISKYLHDLKNDIEISFEYSPTREMPKLIEGHKSKEKLIEGIKNLITSKLDENNQFDLNFFEISNGKTTIKTEKVTIEPTVKSIPIFNVQDMISNFLEKDNEKYLKQLIETKFKNKRIDELKENIKTFIKAIQELNINASHILRVNKDNSTFFELFASETETIDNKKELVFSDVIKSRIELSILNALSYINRYDSQSPKDIARLLGYEDEHEARMTLPNFDYIYSQFIQNGYFYNGISEQIGKTFLQSLGLKLKGLTIRQEKALYRDIATSIIAIAEENGLVTSKKINIKTKTENGGYKAKTYTLYAPTNKVTKLFNNLKDIDTSIFVVLDIYGVKNFEKMPVSKEYEFVEEPTNENHIKLNTELDGVTFKEKASRKIIDGLKVMTNAVWKKNEIYDLYISLLNDKKLSTKFKKALGYIEDINNVNDSEKLKAIGINQTIDRSLDIALRDIKFFENGAKLNAKIVSTNRIMYTTDFNPQADKIHRQLIDPSDFVENSTYDRTNETDLEFIKIALAQTFGIDYSKPNFEEEIKKFTDEKDGYIVIKKRKSIGSKKEYWGIEIGKKLKKYFIKKEDKTIELNIEALLDDMINGNIEYEEPNMLIRNMYYLADLRNKTINKQGKVNIQSNKKVFSGIIMEADGITNGMFIKMALAGGSIDNLKAGGMSFKSKKEEVKLYYKQKEEEKFYDYYEDNALGTIEALDKRLEEFEGELENNSLINIIKSIFNKDNLKQARKFIKKQSQAVGYGQGRKSTINYLGIQVLNEFVQEKIAKINKTIKEIGYEEKIGKDAFSKIYELKLLENSGIFNKENEKDKNISILLSSIIDYSLFKGKGSYTLLIPSINGISLPTSIEIKTGYNVLSYLNKMIKVFETYDKLSSIEPTKLTLQEKNFINQISENKYIELRKFIENLKNNEAIFDKEKNEFITNNISTKELEEIKRNFNKFIIDNFKLSDINFVTNSNMNYVINNLGGSIIGNAIYDGMEKTFNTMMKLNQLVFDNLRLSLIKIEKHLKEKSKELMNKEIEDLTNEELYEFVEKLKEDNIFVDFYINKDVYIQMIEKNNFENGNKFLGFETIEKLYSVQMPDLQVKTTNMLPIVALGMGNEATTMAMTLSNSNKNFLNIYDAMVGSPKTLNEIAKNWNDNFFENLKNINIVKNLFEMNQRVGINLKETAKRQLSLINNIYNEINKNEELLKEIIEEKELKKINQLDDKDKKISTIFNFIINSLGNVNNKNYEKIINIIYEEIKKYYMPKNNDLSIKEKLEIIKQHIEEVEVLLSYQNYKEELIKHLNNLKKLKAQGKTEIVIQQMNTGTKKSIVTKNIDEYIKYIENQIDYITNEIFQGFDTTNKKHIMYFSQKVLHRIFYTYRIQEQLNKINSKLYKLRNSKNNTYVANELNKISKMIDYLYKININQRGFISNASNIFKTEKFKNISIGFDNLLDSLSIKMLKDIVVNDNIVKYLAKNIDFALYKINSKKENKKLLSKQTYFKIVTFKNSLKDLKEKDFDLLEPALKVMNAKYSKNALIRTLLNKISNKKIERKNRTFVFGKYNNFDEYAINSIKHRIDKINEINEKTAKGLEIKKIKTKAKDEIPNKILIDKKSLTKDEREKINEDLEIKRNINDETIVFKLNKENTKKSNFIVFDISIEEPTKDEEAKKIKKSSYDEASGIIVESYKITSKEELQKLFDKLRNIDNVIGFTEIINNKTKENWETIINNYFDMFNKLDINILEDITDLSRGSIDTTNLIVNLQGSSTYANRTREEILVHELVHATIRKAYETETELSERVLSIRNKVKKSIDRNNIPLKIIFGTETEEQGKRIYDYIFNSNDNGEEFLVYALTNNKFIEYLTDLNIKLDNYEKNFFEIRESDAKVEKLLKIIINKIMNLLQKFIFRINNKKTINAEKELQIIYSKLAKINKQIETNKKNVIKKLFDYANEIGSNLIIKIIDNIYSKNKQLFLDIDSNYHKIISNLLKNKNKALGKFISNLILTLTGKPTNKKYKEFYKQFFLIKKILENDRMEFEEEITKHLNSLTKNFTKEEKEKLTNILLKTEAPLFFDNYNELVASLNNIDNEITKLEEEIFNTYKNKLKKEYGEDIANLILYQINDLSEFIISGNLNSNITAFNAYDIATLNNLFTTYVNDNKERFQIVKLVHQNYELINKIDKLITLKAIKKINKQDYYDLNKENIEEIFKYTKQILKTKQEVFKDNMSLYRKGLSSVNKSTQIDLKIIKESEFENMKIYGYKKIKNLHNGQLLVGKDLTLTSYEKGAIETTRINFEKRISVEFGSKLKNKFKLKSVLFQIRLLTKNNKGLFKTNNNVIIDTNSNKEFMLLNHEERKNIFNEDFSYDTMLTKIYSDIYRANFQRDLNNQLVDYMFKLYDKTENKEDFIILSPYKIYKNDYSFEWNLIPEDTRKYIIASNIKENRQIKINEKQKTYEFIPVPKELLDDFIGYENINVSQIKLGKNQKGIPNNKKSALILRGLEELQKFVEDLIEIAKPLIGVINFSIFMANLKSNYLELVARTGKPIWALKKMKEHYMYYLKMKKNKKEKVMKMIIEHKINDIKLEENHPLDIIVNAGLVSSLIEDTDLIAMSGSNRVKDFINKNIDKIKNKEMKALIKNIYITEDSVMFKLLSDLTIASDAISRSVLYEYYTKYENINKEDAIQKTAEAFVMYNLNLPRELNFLNKIGIALFIKYALNILKVIYTFTIKKPINMITLKEIDKNIYNMPDITDTLDNFFYRFGMFDTAISTAIDPVRIDNVFDL